MSHLPTPVLEQENVFKVALFFPVANYVLSVNKRKSLTSTRLEAASSIFWY
jgi:hypothetical protein